MKDAIKEYIDLSDAEKESLWETATFVFDTNVFLNLYRYSKKTRDVLLGYMKELNGRIWMPHQVAYEFMKNRPEVIFESVERYSNLEENILRPCKDKLRIKDDDPDFKNLQKYIKKWIEDYKKNNLLIESTSNDGILDDILQLFDGKTGMSYSKEEVDSIKKEGSERYKKEIPPGYKDNKKANADKDNNAYGDLIVWKQILDFAKNKKKDIIFVTSDQKEDWWNIVHGKTLGPRVELKKEFNDYTGTKFHMYSMDGFISNFESAKGNSGIVDEVKAYNSVPIGMLKLITDFGEYLTNQNDELEYYDIYQIENLIHDVEQKRARRIKELDALRQKYAGQEIPESIQVLIQNLKRNINVDKKRISMLKHKRNEIAHSNY